MFPSLFLAATLGVLSPTVPTGTTPLPKPHSAVASHALSPGHLVSPVLHVSPGLPQHPHVALTFDACTGAADERIIGTLIHNNIKATIFVSGRWLKRNPQALSELLARPDLFQIENHGASHLVAVDRPGRVFGVATAGSIAGVKAEIAGGADAVRRATGHAPRWYRGAAALYSPDALAMVAETPTRIAGFSLAADGGALFSTKRAATMMARAQNGDVILAHINHPANPAGQGIVEGLLALKAKGYVFVRLNEPHIGH